MTLAWHLRFYHNWIGSPIPGTWGVNIDWTRHHIVQTGYIGDLPRPFTDISSFAGAQNYDFASILYAVVDIVVGKTRLVSALEVLNTTQFVGLVLFPTIFVTWYLSASQRNDGLDWNWFHLFLVLGMVLFPAGTTILKTSQVWFTETIATAILLLSIFLLPRIGNSVRHRLLFILLLTLMINLYHTWVFLYILIIGTVFVFEVMVTPLTHRRSPELNLVGLALIGAVFFLVGGYVNNHFYELTDNLIGSFLPLVSQPTGGSQASSQQFYSATDSSLIKTDVATVLSNPNLRRVMKLFNYAAAFSIVVIFGVLKAYQVVIRRRKLNTHERTIFYALFAFPIVMTMFYVLSNLAGVVGRTHYVGIYFVLFSAGLLLLEESDIVRKATTILVVILVLTAIPAALSSGILQPYHTKQEETAIIATGRNVPNDEYVFSDASLGPPLEYFEMQGIAILQVTHKSWTQRIRDIYYRKDPTQALRAIRSTIRESRIREDAPRPDSFYVFMSSGPQQQGVHLLSFVTIPTGVDPRQKFNHNQKTVKIYSSGEVTLFRHEPTST